MENLTTSLAPNWLDCMIAHLYYQTGNIAKTLKEGSNKKTKAACGKILLVEDDEMVQMVNSEYLKAGKFKVDVASDYWQALKLYKTGKYDLIVTDVGLPGKNGIELCRKIRELEASKAKQTPVVVITAYGDNVASECYQAGANHFALKPLLQNELIQIVGNLLNQAML